MGAKEGGEQRGGGRDGDTLAKGTLAAARPLPSDGLQGLDPHVPRGVLGENMLKAPKPREEPVGGRHLQPGGWGPAREGGRGPRNVAASPRADGPRCPPWPPAVPYLHYINNGLNVLINTC